ncbi:hypothetical protein WSM22_22830 [Cytophagales bacterium WSM2-2]|nr:hypothetical protein WSM22_22830 [Cytophagales bacterium WSM2-2]
MLSFDGELGDIIFAKKMGLNEFLEKPLKEKDSRELSSACCIYKNMFTQFLTSKRQRENLLDKV